MISLPAAMCWRRGAADIGGMPFPRPLRGRVLGAAPAVLIALGAASRVHAQTPTDSVAHDSVTASRRAPSSSRHHYWRRMAAGFASSLLAHEGAHVVTAVAVGGRPRSE